MFCLIRRSLLPIVILNRTAASLFLNFLKINWVQCVKKKKMLHLVEELTNGSIEAARCWSDPLKLVPVLPLGHNFRVKDFSDL